MRQILILAVLLVAGTAHADIYKTPGQCLSGYREDGPFPGWNPWGNGVFNSVAGDYCPRDLFVWPTMCIPAHRLVDGTPVARQCREFGPNQLDTSIGVNLSAAPAEAINAYFRIWDTGLVYDRFWPRHTAAGYPTSQLHVDRGLDYQQLLEVTLIAAFGTRDTAPGQPRFAPGDIWDSYEVCEATPGPRCTEMYRILRTIEGLSRHPRGYGLSRTQLVNILEVLMRTPEPAPDDAECGRPMVCGQYRAEQLP